MKPKPNESFEDFLARFNKASQPIVEEAANRQRFVSNTRRRRLREQKARERWQKRRAWLRYKHWREDKYDGGR